jgi:hypothetical protein
LEKRLRIIILKRKALPSKNKTVTERMHRFKLVTVFNQNRARAYGHLDVDFYSCVLSLRKKIKIDDSRLLPFFFCC